MRCYERDGWTDEAYALQRQRFEREPSVERYQAAVAADAAAGQPAEAVRTALFSVVDAAEQRAVDAPAFRRGPAGSTAGSADRPDVKRARRHSLRRVELARRLGGRPAAPRVRRVDASAHRASSAAHPSRRGGARSQTIVHASDEGSISPYREALALVADIAQRMGPVDRSAWLHGLRVEFKAKRSFVGGLPG